MALTPLYVEQELRSELASQRARMLRDPAEAVPPVDLGLPHKYIFRTKPGMFRGAIVHTLDVPPDEFQLNTTDEKKIAFYLKRWEKKHSGKGEKERYASLVEKLGGKNIRFTRVPGAKECFFATDDQEVADYIRDLIRDQRGEFAYVYEQNGKARWIVGDGTEFAKAFPDTSLGIQAAQRYATEHNLNDIKRVTE